MSDNLAVIYLRDSGGARQELSIEQQESALREYAAKAGLDVARVFQDAARSGTTTVGRDDFLEMVEYLDANGKHTVLMWDYSRFGRDYDDSQHYLTHLRRGKNEIVSLKEYIPSGLIGRVVESLHVYTAAQYSQQLSANIKRGLHYLASQYKSFPSGAPPIGYQLDPVEIGRRRDGSPHYARRLVPDPVKAPIVRQAFEMRAAGHSVPEIHAETHLFEWARPYHGMFANRVYTGTLDYHGTIVPEFCEPLVALETWDAIQKRRKLHPRREASAYLLSGLVVCAQCGGRMGGQTRTKPNGKQYRYYFCPRNAHKFGGCTYTMHRRDDIDNAVLNTLRDALLSADVLRQVHDELARQYSEHQDASVARIDALHHSLDDIDRKRRRLVSALESDEGAPRAVLDRLRELETEQQAQREELALLEAKRPTPPPPAENIDGLGAEVWDAIQEARDSDTRTLQLLLRSMLGEVRIGRDADGKTYGDVLINEIPSIGITAYRLPLRM